jgi:hypothetical protein
MLLLTFCIDANDDDGIQLDSQFDSGSSDHSSSDDDEASDDSLDEDAGSGSSRPTSRRGSGSHRRPESFSREEVYVSEAIAESSAETTEVPDNEFSFLSKRDSKKAAKQSKVSARRAIFE